MVNVEHDPFSLLYELDQESRATAPGLPQQTEVAAIWTGLGFRVGDLRLLAPLDQVSEVVPYAVVTPVPGTKRWLKGIANVRGDLLTIVDLADFLGKEPIVPDADSRLLIMNVPGLNSALLVPEVIGLRHFVEEDDRAEIPDVEEPVRSCLRGAFFQDETLWGQFDMQVLAQLEVFRHVAA